MSADRPRVSERIEDDGAGKRPTGRWRFDSRWLAGGVVGLVLLHAVILGILRYRGDRPSPAASLEVSLGEFQCCPLTTRSPSDNEVPRTKFHLHVSLLRESPQFGRSLLAARQHKVRQEVEQLLRRAHTEDFDDPTLAGLKRQIQETINQTLAADVAAEVIITNLSPPRLAPTIDTSL